MEGYIVSARKYRPSTFETVVGQRSLTDTLRNAIRQNHLAHAYLFCGPRGVGKTTCARIFAKTINCLNPTDSHDACNECESCRAFNEQRSFNIHELDAASNNSVEDIRQLIQEVRIPPQIGKYSVYIIDEVHMLSQGAFNALLKTLEEPPSYAVFILATTEKHKVLPTILSRCQVYDFQRITIADIVAHLQYVAQQEGVEAEEQALNVVAQKADGGMRDALSVFDQLVAYCGGKITYRQTIEVLNVLDSDYYFRAVRFFLQGDVPQALLLFNEVLGKGFDAGVFVTGLAEHLRDVLVARDGQTLPLLEVSDSVREQYRQQAAECSAVWIFKALDVINTCDVQYRTARNKRLTVEIALVKLCRLMSNDNEAETASPAQPVRQTTVRQQPSAVASAPAASPAPAVQKSAAAPKTISVNRVMPVAKTAGVPAAPVTAAPAATQPQNTPFTLDLLLDAWAGLNRYFPKEERLNAIFTDYRPTLNGTTACIALANPWQKEEFRRFEKQILQHLRQALHNDAIQFTVEVTEHTRGRVLTPTEQFEQLVKEYPVVAELKQALSLQLE